MKEIGGNQAGLAYTSVGIAFAFALSHVSSLANISIVEENSLSKALHTQCKEEDAEANVVNNKKMSKMVQLPTVSIIELDSCEPLLA